MRTLLMIAGPVWFGVALVFVSSLIVVGRRGIPDIDANTEIEPLEQ